MKLINFYKAVQEKQIKKILDAIKWIKVGKILIWWKKNRLDWIKIIKQLKKYTK